MGKKTTSGIMLTLLLASMLMLAPSIQPVRASGTIYIKADGSVEGTDKIQRDGDIYSFIDNINEEIVVEKSNIIIDGNSYMLQGAGSGRGFFLEGRTNVTIRSTKIMQFNTGISLVASPGNTITENTVSSNTHGIHLLQSTGCTVNNNIVASNQGGIIVYQGSNYTTVENNTVYSNTVLGIDLGMANWCTVASNNLTNNMFGGVWLEHSSSNTFFGNVIRDGVLGMRFDDSRENTIYHNNFFNNTYQVITLAESFNNLWDDGYPSGGNYWSDYTSRYPGAQELDDSGIWDTPYVIDDYNQDGYPLMERWAPTSPTIMATSDVDPDTFNLKSEGKWITAYIQLPEGYDPADIDSSTILLNGTVAPVVDPKYDFVTHASDYLVDHNCDGVLERMVKFDKASIASWIYQSVGMQHEVSLTITGELADGTPFEGTTTIFVVFFGGWRRKTQITTLLANPRR